MKRIAGPDAVENAIAFARYSDGSFGWGVTDPGTRNGVRQRRAHPRCRRRRAPVGKRHIRSPAAARLAGGRPRRVEDYLLDIQPGYRFDPVRGVYNHAWLMGDESAISLATQAKIDALEEIVPVRRQGKSS